MTGPSVEIELITRDKLRFSKMFEDFPIRLGRAPNNDWVLTSDVISRRHARIELVGGELVIADEGSRAGTFVARGSLVRIEGPVLLSEVDGTFQLASYRFRVLSLRGTHAISQATAAETTRIGPALPARATEEDAEVFAALWEGVRALRAEEQALVTRSLQGLDVARRRLLIRRLAERYPSLGLPTVAARVARSVGAGPDDHGRREPRSANA